MRRICGGLALLFSSLALGADVKVVGEQAIFSGQIQNNELAQLRDLAAEHGSKITTIVLRGMRPGGGEWIQARMAADYIRDRGWRTAVSGDCSGACAVIFLGGGSRHFTDDQPAGNTRIGLTGWYFLETTTIRGYGKSQFNPIAVQKARDWVKQSTQRKITEEVLNRFLPAEWSEDENRIYFYDVTRLKRKDRSVFVCNVKNPAHRKLQDCPVLETDAFRQGIVTSADIITSNDMGREFVKPSDSEPRPQAPEK